MTDHNNAALAAEQDPLSDEYVNAVIRQHGYGHPTAVAARLWQWIGLHGGENGVTLLIYEAHKALSKLRAEGVQAGEPVADSRLPLEKALYELVNKIDTGLDSGDLVQDARRASTVLDAIMTGGDLVACAHTFFKECGEDKWRDRYERSLDFRIGWNACLDAIDEARAKRAALASAPATGERECGNADCGWRGTTERMCGSVGPLCPECGETTEASAPVAGEARPAGWQSALRIAELPEVDEALANFCDDSTLDNAVGLVLAVIGAAPQASEAVRILFPAHLRKMWSGGEVQAWLDEHRGITPPKASAKGSLERYRKWQVEQAQAEKGGGGCTHAFPVDGTGSNECIHCYQRPYARRPILKGDRQAWEADMKAAGAQHLGGDCWEWDAPDFEFRLWKLASRRQQRAALASPTQPSKDGGGDA